MVPPALRDEREVEQLDIRMQHGQKPRLRSDINLVIEEWQNKPLPFLLNCY